MMHRFQQFQHRNKHHPGGGIRGNMESTIPPHHTNRQMENMNMDNMRQQMGNMSPNTFITPETMDATPMTPPSMGQMGNMNN